MKSDKLGLISHYIEITWTAEYYQTLYKAQTVHLVSVVTMTKLWYFLSELLHTNIIKLNSPDITTKGNSSILKIT